MGFKLEKLRSPQTFILKETVSSFFVTCHNGSVLLVTLEEGLPKKPLKAKPLNTAK